ncbi:MAG: DUF3793 family protein [Eubacteriales bacterium]|nr:DUF3793 family protein [Eubacteriales bacterium]
MSDELVVQFGSPTLAGIKTGNLFTCPYTDRGQTMKELRRLNRALCPKGLRILPLRYSAERVLIYLYRPKQLEKDLAGKEAAELLERAGYRPGSATECVVELIHRLNDLKSEFPHEIGLFLSYPPEDVRGFIDHGGNRNEGCKLVGVWRVYGDEERARKLFEQYRKCTESFCKQLSEGVPLARLAVAV